ncbi:ROK family protein [Verminephrobacter aporrectodeae subsp. tuberculatae]|uniref:N-acetylglucosamine kinase n=1 Tax=Verminephrobacter aporrectodeae subsp. tuberculatae TaxID=1110392 RepID=A0ABT3KRP3_9BURK|nr:ROK family protein [Verminephrobacter aporrectodeae]MCW5320935.1 ROK family protein [Verminephrobacter aporrectodeae subsp. tuberculatae]MCW8200675.1 ROK family protein [Verminephrobacter aporrectodeae subsp. tuberculatae]
MWGAIDLGGTKIEACLYDAQLQPVQRQRVATPQGAYAGLLDAIEQQCLWLQGCAGDAHLPIGMGIPGLIDRQTGLSTTANLSAMGQPLQADLSARLGRPIAVENDCKCFALSEAQGGAGAGQALVFGLILGTGVGGGLCRQGELMLHHLGISGEVGHVALPVHCTEQWRLPVLRCGCGRTGCYETYVSGPGMARLCQHLTGRALGAQDIAQGHARGDAQLQTVYRVWLWLLCELLHTMQLAIDPDCVVFGGGLSRIPGLPEQVAQAFPAHQLPGLRAPRFASAQFGDSSGVRGAAILAQRLQENRHAIPA